MHVVLLVLLAAFAARVLEAITGRMLELEGESLVRRATVGLPREAVLRLLLVSFRGVVAGLEARVAEARRLVGQAEAGGMVRLVEEPGESGAVPAVAPGASGWWGDEVSAGLGFGLRVEVRRIGALGLVGGRAHPPPWVVGEVSGCATVSHGHFVTI